MRSHQQVTFRHPNKRRIRQVGPIKTYPNELPTNSTLQCHPDRYNSSSNVTSGHAHIKKTVPLPEAFTKLDSDIERKQEHSAFFDDYLSA